MHRWHVHEYLDGPDVPSYPNVPSRLHRWQMHCDFNGKDLHKCPYKFDWLDLFRRILYVLYFLLSWRARTSNQLNYLLCTNLNFFKCPDKINLMWKSERIKLCNFWNHRFNGYDYIIQWIVWFWWSGIRWASVIIRGLANRVSIRYVNLLYYYFRKIGKSRFTWGKASALNAMALKLHILHVINLNI